MQVEDLLKRRVIRDSVAWVVVIMSCGNHVIRKNAAHAGTGVSEGAASDSSDLLAEQDDM